MKVQTAAASASATSSPNITETDNYIYSSTFRTVKWDGEIVAQRIDTISGNVLPGDRLVGAGAARRQHHGDQRFAQHLHHRRERRRQEEAVHLREPLAAPPSGGIAAEQAYFDNKCTALSQCALLTRAAEDSSPTTATGW